jgi:hypothetical protein
MKPEEMTTEDGRKYNAVGLKGIAKICGTSVNKLCNLSKSGEIDMPEKIFIGNHTFAYWVSDEFRRSVRRCIETTGIKLRMKTMMERYGCPHYSPSIMMKKLDNQRVGDIQAREYLRALQKEKDKRGEEERQKYGPIERFSPKMMKKVRNGKIKYKKRVNTVDISEDV